ncbi:hypothetical protein B0O80DRAFT_437778 [Mortierella sp. GBAus27b]|nr:hypothetical protein B0O80DRAFT_437778 [Mortierella sp. GBAus27b]
MLVHDSCPCLAACAFMLLRLFIHDPVACPSMVQCLSIESVVKSKGNPMKLKHTIVRGHQQVHRCTNRLDR